MNNELSICDNYSNSSHNKNKNNDKYLDNNNNNINYSSYKDWLKEFRSKLLIRNPFD